MKTLINFQTHIRINNISYDYIELMFIIYLVALKPNFTKSQTQEINKIYRCNHFSMFPQLCDLWQYCKSINASATINLTS